MCCGILVTSVDILFPNTQTRSSLGSSGGMGGEVGRDGEEEEEEEIIDFKLPFTGSHGGNMGERGRK